MINTVYMTQHTVAIDEVCAEKPSLKLVAKVDIAVTFTLIKQSHLPVNIHIFISRVSQIF